MTEQEILRDNIAQLEALDPKKYPMLYRMLYRRNSSLRAHLLHMLTYMQAHPIPFEVDQQGRGYWKIPKVYMMKTYGGSSESWQSHLAFLLDAGLLVRIRPDQRSILPRLREEWQRALATGQHAAGCYRVVPYTEERLAEAEAVATRYAQAGVGVAHVTKTEVIYASGQEQANILYRTSDKVGDAESWVREKLGEKILAAIEADGYARWEPIYSDVKNELLLKHLADRADENVKKRINAIKKMDTRKKEVCRQFGCDRHPPRRADRERFGLEDQGWIITKVEDAEA